MTTASYWLPWPVTVNHYYLSVRGTVVISPRGKEFSKEVYLCIQQQGGMRFSDRVSLRVDLYPKTKRKYDADNVLKSLLDSLEKAGVLSDDEIVWDLHVVKHEKDSKIQGARVTITAM